MKSSRPGLRCGPCEVLKTSDSPSLILSSLHPDFNRRGSVNGIDAIMTCIWRQHTTIQGYMIQTTYMMQYYNKRCHTAPCRLLRLAYCIIGMQQHRCIMYRVGVFCLPPSCRLALCHIAPDRIMSSVSYLVHNISTRRVWHIVCTVLCTTRHACIYVDGAMALRHGCWRCLLQEFRGGPLLLAAGPRAHLERCVLVPPSK